MERIKVELCHNHFERIIKNDVCASCPSKAENEAIVRLIAAQAKEDPGTGMGAVFRELASIREMQAHFADKIESLDETIKGNGKPGILNRITAIETRFSTLQTSIVVFMGIVSIAVAVLAIVFT